MTTPRRLLPRLPALALVLLASACGTESAERALAGASGDPPVLLGARGATITGTVVDAESGAPLAGVLVEGPGGTRAVSDAQGRFTLTGVPVGAEGELVARDDGAEARNPLRPVRAGTLEVVLRLRRP